MVKSSVNQLAKHLKIVDRADPSFWEQKLPGEPDVWFNRFRLYLLMPQPRTVVGAKRIDMRSGNREKKITSAGQTWNKAFQTFVWAERANAFDDSIYRNREQVFKDWDYELLKNRKELSLQMMEKSKRMLSFPLDRQTMKQSEDGTQQVVIKPARWGFRDAAALALAGSELGDQAVRRPNVDMIAAIELLVSEGVLPASVLDEIEDGYNAFIHRLRKVVKPKLLPPPVSQLFEGNGHL